jgi:hypothetical protein
MIVPGCVTRVTVYDQLPLVKALWSEFEYAGSRELMTAQAIAYAEALRKVNRRVRS